MLRTEKKKRIFWLGMHKVLVETEYAFLKEMGYEVFRPPYLSSIRDQSASEKWSAGETTLPDEVIDRLSRTNFFYQPIPKTIGKILNLYFDAIIVTIHPDWLYHILKVYQGTVIYRCYGQIDTVSERLFVNGAFNLIEGRGNFWFLPHAEECLADEQSWLQRYAQVVPYWVTDDVIEHKDSWAKSDNHTDSIALTCPHISNAYYQKHYQYLKAFFHQKWCRYYGVQFEKNADPNVVGTLSRKEFLDRFRKESGYLYTYRERNVCYLPPIEMMILGGPVLYFPGSLLHRYFGFDSPGLVNNEEEAIKRSHQLLRKDQTLIAEIIKSQEQVRNRYIKENTQSKFKNAINDILKNEVHSVKEKIVYDPDHVGEHRCKPVLILGHFENNYVFKNGEYASVNGIPRVMRQFVRALNMKKIPVVVTSIDKDTTKAHGFYASVCDRPDLVKVMPVPRIKNGLFNSRSILSFRRVIDACSAVVWSSSSKWFTILVEVWRRQRKINSISKFIEFVAAGFIFSILFPGALIKIFRRLQALATIATDQTRWRYAIVSHYFLFPEALDFRTPLLAYIPDYMPHFFRGRYLFPDNLKNSEVGKEIARKAKRVFTNSQFSKRYLPETALSVPYEKINTFLMPYLNGVESKPNNTFLEGEILRKLIGKKYIFYPTQPNPNKRLDLLINGWNKASIKMKEEQLYLVLTALSIPEPLMNEIRQKNLTNRIFIFPYINDATLEWLYRNAVCLAFSSEMEGNFPTQVLEALMNECPIVCMDHPLIKSELGEDTRFLLTAPFADIEQFSELILYSLNHREEILSNQRILREKVGERFEFKSFMNNVWKLDEVMVSE